MFLWCLLLVFALPRLTNDVSHLPHCRFSPVARYQSTILALTIWNKLRSFFSPSAAGGVSGGIERPPKQRHRTTKRHVRLKESIDSGNQQAETVIAARGMAVVDTGRRANAEVKMRSPPPATPSPQPPIPVIHVCGEVDQLHIKDCFRVSENKTVGLTF
ncbi:hypothetical protein Ddc_14500 [Ditylenchus destructor]|nr:hypothetical protein Ddc_14500 [Ditylenchus destructor]